MSLNGVSAATAQAGTGTTSTSAAAASATALNAISGNFNSFLTLLTTQLQNQDPSSPMDTSQFTSELAQFAGVQQQVDTNTNLASLIQLTQSQSMLQGTSLLGKQVTLNSQTLPPQNGSAQLSFTSPVAQPVQISVTDANGAVVQSATVMAQAGSNGWSWNGLSASGVTEPDGSYGVSVTANGAGGTTTPLGFTTSGTVSGVTNSGGTIDLQFGSATIPLSDVALINS